MLNENVFFENYDQDTEDFFDALNATEVISYEQQKILFNILIEKITIDEMYIPGEKEVCLHITIYMKIPGYDPKHSLYFKRDLKKLDKEKTNSYSKNKSSSLDVRERIF